MSYIFYHNKYINSMNSTIKLKIGVHMKKMTYYKFKIYIIDKS